MTKMTTKFITLFIVFISITNIYAQENFAIPKSYANLSYDSTGTLIFTTKDGDILSSVPHTDYHSLSSLRSLPVGTDTGIDFNFQNLFTNCIYVISIGELCTFLFKERPPQVKQSS